MIDNKIIAKLLNSRNKEDFEVGKILLVKHFPKEILKMELVIDRNYGRPWPIIMMDSDISKILKETVCSKYFFILDKEEYDAISSESQQHCNTSQDEHNPLQLG